MVINLCKSVQLCYFAGMAKARSGGPWWGAIAVVLFVTPLAAPPAAETVFFAGGRAISIVGHSVQGESVVLALRGGGELLADTSLIDRIVPDPDNVSPLQTPAPVVVSTPVASRLPVEPQKPYAELVQRASERHGVDPRLVFALIEVESGYRPNAESPRGAMGLMQLMPSTARRYAVSDPFDPEDNINAGTRHLRTLLDEFGTQGALAAYNAGEVPVRRFDGIPPYPETRKYVSRVLEIVGAEAGRR